MINPFKKDSESRGPLSNENNYVWLKSIKSDWVIRFEIIATYALLASIPGSIICFALWHWASLPVAIPAILTMNIFLLYFTCEYLKQNIKCPKCSYKPSLNKEQKLVHSKVLNDRLFKLKSCPNPKCQ